MLASFDHGLADLMPLQEIEKALVLYSPASRYVTSASMNRDGELRCTLRHFRHPFQRREPAHMTREHAVLYGTQAVCVYAAAAIAMGRAQSLDWPTFEGALINETALIRSMQVEFTSVVKAATNYQLSMRCVRHLRIRGTHAAVLTFAIDNNCIGRVTAAAA